MRVEKFEWFMLMYHVCAQYRCFYGLGVYFAGMGAVHNVISEGMRSSSKKKVYIMSPHTRHISISRMDSMNGLILRLVYSVLI